MDSHDFVVRISLTAFLLATRSLAVSLRLSQAALLALSSPLHHSTCRGGTGEELLAVPLHPIGSAFIDLSRSGTPPASCQLAGGVPGPVGLLLAVTSQGTPGPPPVVSEWPSK